MKLQELSVKENKNNKFIYNSSLPHPICCGACHCGESITTHALASASCKRHMRVLMHVHVQRKQQHHAHALLTCMRRDTLSTMAAHRSRRDVEEKNCWINFFFSLCTKSSDVTWTILLMSLLRFWTWEVVLLSMQGSMSN